MKRSQEIRDLRDKVEEATGRAFVAWQSLDDVIREQMAVAEEAGAITKLMDWGEEPCPHGPMFRKKGCLKCWDDLANRGRMSYREWLPFAHSCEYRIFQSPRESMGHILCRGTDLGNPKRCMFKRCLSKTPAQVSA